MKTGFDHVDKAAEDARNRSSQGFSGRLNYFNWKNGDTKILRFLTDEVLLVQFYEMVVDNQGKFKDFIVATDLHEDDPNWHGEDWVLKYGGKVHENGMAFAEAWQRCRPLLKLGAPVACEVLKLAKRGSRSGCQLSHVERLDYVLNDMSEMSNFCRVLERIRYWRIEDGSPSPRSYRAQ